MAYEQNAVLMKDFYLKVRNRYNTMARQNVKDQLEDVAGLLDNIRQAIIQVCGRNDTQVLQETLDTLRADTVKIHHLTEELSRPFLLFLIGTGKFGKSTLINALLGREMPQVVLLPKTWKIDICYGGNDKKTEICYRDGHKVHKSFEETLTLVQHEEDERERSEQQVQDMFEANRKNLKTAKAKREYQEELRKYMLYRSEITEIHWPVPIGNPLLQNFRLVDTPGTQQQMTLGQVEASAADYYSKADGILWLLAADKISAKDTRENIDAILDRFGQRTDNIVAVLNKKDLVERNGGPEALAKVQADAQRLYGDVFQEIVPISASQALKAVLSGQGQQEQKDSGLPQLLSVIDRYFLTRAQQIQVSSKIGGTQSILNDIRHTIEAYQQRLRREAKKRQKLVAAWQKERENLDTTAKNMIDSCFSSQVEQVRRRAQSHENQLWDLEGYARQRMVEEIFDNASFKVVADGAVRQVAAMIERARSIYIQDSAFYEFPDLQKESKYLTTTGNSTLAQVQVDDDIFSTNNGAAVIGGIAALGAAALLGPVGLLAGLVVQSDAFKPLKKFVSRLFTNLPNKITEQYSSQLNPVKANILKEMKLVLDQAEQEVQKVREQTYADLYGPSEETEAILVLMDDIVKNTELKLAPLTVRDVVFGQQGRGKSWKR